MLKYIHQFDAPPIVRKISLLIVSYAIIVLISNIVSLLQYGFIEPTQTFRGFLRVIGMTGIAIWLLSLNKLAWWIATGLIGFFLVGVVVGMMTMLYFASLTDDIVQSLIFRLAVPMYLLAHAFVLLLNRNTRRHFFV